MNERTPYQEMILLKCGEMVLKGLNRRVFEDQLLKNVRHRLSRIGQFSVRAMQSTVYIRPEGESRTPETVDNAVEAMRQVYGVVAICRTAECEKDMEAILRLVPAYCADELARVKTFRAEVRRSDKLFPLTSPEIAAEAGGAILDAFPHLTVSLDHPELVVYIEIRDRAAYVHAGKIAGAGGLPVGVGGQALLLLSGGIDSPVAGHMMAKRGVKVDAIHFHSYPFTSLQALEKVKGLRDIVAAYTGDIKLYSYNMLDAYTAINQNMNVSYTTVVSRRIMMRVAKKLAHDKGYDAIITGENIGQVASQTMYGIKAIEDATDMVIFRPLIAFDKLDIIDIAKKIGTYEKSIEPFDDCCSVFSPDHPQTRPLIADVKREEEKVDIDAIVEDIYKKGELI